MNLTETAYQSFQREIENSLLTSFEAMRMLARPGIAFTRWQKIRIKFCLFIHRIKDAQNIILKIIERIYK